jgi:hypothetical protein
MFLDYGGKYLSLKAFHNLVEKVSLMTNRFEKEVRKLLRTVKRLLCCRFRRTGRAMGQVYHCWRRICREIKVFSSFEYHIFYVLYPLWLICWLSLVIKHSDNFTFILPYVFLHYWSRDSVVGIATGYGLDDRGVGVRIVVGSRIFSSPLRPDWLWGPPSRL